MNKEQEILNTTNLIHNAPNEEFSVIKQTQLWTIVVYKFLPLVDTTTITLTKQQFEFPLFNLYFLHSLSILSAYVFFVPVCHVYHNPFYMRFLLPSAQQLTKFTNAKLLMQDNRITVFHSHDGASLVSVNGLKRVIRTIMVRRSEKNMHEDNEEND